MSYMPKLNAAGTAYVKHAWETTGQPELLVDSGAVANAPAAANLPAVAGKVNQLYGVDLTIGGATAASIVNLTVTGIVGGTQTFPVAVPAGVASITPCTLTFDPPLQATAANVAIGVSLAALGTGNTIARTVSRGGFLA